MSQDAWKTLLLGFLDGDLNSHPGKKLTDHLNGTLLLAEDTARFHSLSAFIPTLSYACLTHDIGKADKLFQAHLKGGAGVEHSAPSSFFTLLCHGETVNEYSLFERFLAAEAVRRHHTRIEDWNTIFNFWTKENFYEEITKTINNLLPSYEISANKKEFDAFLLKLFNIEDYAPKENYWFELKTILSLLVAADRMNAINIYDNAFESIPEFHIKEYPSARNMIDEWRTQIAGECHKAVKKILSPGIFTLTLPTGAGKTNIGLDAAYTLAKKFDCKTIIYTMPFISIVEQNADFARQIFAPEMVQEDHSGIIYADSEDINEKSENDTRVQEKRMRCLFRYWNAPVVITTMSQLWDVIFNPKAGASINFHRLSKAVIIIDEPQSINICYWHQFGKMLDFLHKKFGTIFILMTATQPHIGTYHEIATTQEIPVNRHSYKIIEGKHKLSELPRILSNNVVDYKEKSGMIVLNTRKSAYKIYKMFSEQSKSPVFLLSRWMTPAHRKTVICQIAEMQKNNELCHLIATQVVEAGVDLDFDWVFRDIGPFDNIIQAAGRCNRSALREEGFVLIAEIINDKGKPFSEFIYDPVIMNHTKEILKHHISFTDKDVKKIIAEYYTDLLNAMPSSDIWKNIVTGKWGVQTPLWKQENYNEVSVYVDTEGNVHQLLSKLREIKPSLENREDIKMLHSRLSQYLINVNITEIDTWMNNIGMFISDSQTEEMLECFDNYYVITKSGIGKDKIYHETAGFQPFIGKINADEF